ncbi:MAG TPA: GAK system ATP-grasp enzyme [Desulfohalobiaceae bacterium]|nr:GAK system ATP-grasp enzyme [Desulfohalobiaceae bacterium]
MVKIGVVGTKGGWSSERLADAVEEQTGWRMLIDMDNVCLDLSEKKIWFQDIDLGQLDALMIKKIGARYSPDLLDRLELLRFVEEQGVKIFSSPLNVMRVVDRLSCTISLHLVNIPMPPTTITEDISEAVKAVKRYGQAIFKPLFTSKARGMQLISSDQNVEEKLTEFKALNPMMYIQKKIELNGRDLGIAFLNDRYLTTYARYNHGHSWNTTTENGGKYGAYSPDLKSIDLAYKAQEFFGLDFTCVDLVETEDGPFVFEVSAFGGFRGIMEAQGIDAAKLFTSYVLNQVNHA